MILTPGQILTDRYRIVGLLGQGGMAAVYCAHDRALDRLVAVKQLRPDPTASPRALEQAREQFQREAQILATLDHPNMPRVTDYFTSDGEEYLVMDYVEGQSLHEAIEQQGSGLDEDLVLDWADQLLDALQYIHKHGIIHRDVKPSNIRLTPEGRIMLVDFGLLKLFDPNNLKTATVMHGLGTPEYAPPEQYDARAGHTDPRSDLYSLGATLYHLLTGQAPATATQRVANPDSFRPPRALGANISADLERAILHAMELRVTHRFDSATEMRAALAELRRRKPVVEGSGTRRLPQWVTPPRRFFTRRLAPLAAFALLIVGGVLGLASGSGSGAGASASATPTNTSTRAVIGQPATRSDTPSPTPTILPATQTRAPGAASLTPSPTSTPTPTATQTHTRRPLTATNTLLPTLTFTPRPPRELPTATFTPRPTLTFTPEPTGTPEPTDTPTTRPTAPSQTPTQEATTSAAEPSLTNTPSP